MIDQFVEGWTEAIVLKLTADGSVFDLTGKTSVVQLFARGHSTPKTLAGSSGNVSGQETQGRVQYLPDAADLLASESPLRVRIQVTENSSGRIAYFPQDTPAEWTIRKP